MQAAVTGDAVRARLLVWWVIWFSLIAGLCIQYYFLASPLAADEPAVPGLLDFFPLLPLVASVVVRWLVLPKCTKLPAAFVTFIAGISLAEACGIFGIFLARIYTDELFVLGVLGIAQFAPFHARRFFETRGAGLRPGG